MNSDESLEVLKQHAAKAQKQFERFMAFLLFVGLFCIAVFVWLKFDPEVLGLADCSKLDPKWMSECSKHQSFSQCESNLGDLRGVHCR